MICTFPKIHFPLITFTFKNIIFDSDSILFKRLPKGISDVVLVITWLLKMYIGLCLWAIRIVVSLYLDLLDKMLTFPAK